MRELHRLEDMELGGDWVWLLEAGICPSLRVLSWRRDIQRVCLDSREQETRCWVGALLQGWFETRLDESDRVELSAI